jgi:hypothetical protein
MYEASLLNYDTQDKVRWNSALTIQKTFRGLIGRKRAAHLQLANERNRLKSKNKRITIKKKFQVPISSSNFSTEDSLNRNVSMIDDDNTDLIQNQN